MTRHSRTMKTLCALALALALWMGACAPLNVEAKAAGLFGWLLGGSKPAEDEEAFAEVTPAPEQTSRADAAVPEEAWSFDPSPEPTPLPPVPEANLEDDGVLRVDLRSLDGPGQLHLTLAGVYAVEGDPGFRFDRDARVTVSAAEGEVWLAAGGLTLDMGNSFTLTRHSAGEGEQNGIYIEESEKEALFCGDLKLMAEGDRLRAVLRIHVEDYLYGVVAYEMSDSFPIEALKAQAVAARTYALQRKWQSGGREYDLVDTTADQVYRGLVADYANVIQAVDDTRGVVGLYDGAFAICYYTASNGGQTALPSQVWGTADADGYLAMEDDPYDVENPNSLRNELTVTERCEGSAALKAMLEEALGDALAAEGFGEGEWEFDSIASIEPVDPRFEGSRMFEGLRFGLRARLLVPAATPTPEATATPATSGEPVQAAPTEFLLPVDGTPAAGGGIAAATADAEATPAPREWVLSDETYAVTLDVYGQIKDGLSLGLNGADCELISVETGREDSGDARSFTIVMTRFGHGVGMSQRGAQWMAGHYGMTWRQILAFYYPGMSVERMEWPDAALTGLDELPAGVGAARPRPTATPTPAPLPALEEGERYATVTATTLNVRERPTTASRAIAQLAQGRRVIVCTEPDGDGWVGMRTAELKGFVKAEYLEMK